MTTRCGRLRLLATLPAASLIALFCGCGGWTPATAPAPPPDLPAAILHEVSVAASDAGVVRWLVRTPVAQGDPNAALSLTAPRLEVYDEAGARTATARAGQAVVHRLSQDVQARGGVRVEARDGLVVVTDSLLLLGSSRRMMTAARVTVSRRGSRLSGVGFDSDASLKTYRILGQLEARVVDSTGEFRVD